MVKCVQCGKEADYIYRGDSLCADHLQRKTNPNPEVGDQFGRIVKLREWGLIEPSMPDERIAETITAYTGLKISAEQVERIRGRIFSKNPTE